MPDAVVIGAGPAGSTAALLLAGRGWKVLLVEQHLFPRHKVCGECLSPMGIEVVRRLNLADAFHANSPISLTRLSLHPVHGRSLTVSLPQPMWGLSRCTFDTILLEAARQAGATLLQPVRCEAIDFAPSPSIRIRDLHTNSLRTIHASHVLLADGRAALLPARPPVTSDFGIKAHFQAIDAPGNTIELFGFPGHYGGLAPIEDNRWNLALSVPRHRLQSCRGNIDTLFSKLLSENPVLRRRFASARRVTDWLASPLPRFSISRNWPPGIIPIGNAAAALEPIGGEGIGLAMRSAELAVIALDEYEQTGCDRALRTLPTRFHRLWRTRRLTCRLAALAMSSPTFSHIAVGRHRCLSLYLPLMRHPQ